ncbi:MAG: hypothetical protein HFI40_14305 [Lachnospiraceae bacterium]|jgi:hypothetical protein|nr:hypothetical protein [Lachnospiraceae bacterium]
MITAFHSFWSKPNRIKNNGAVIIPDFELLVMVLSALTWQSIQGPIRMITDSEGAEFLAGQGLSGLWSEPPDCSLDAIPPELDAFLFWAAGKLVALQTMECPCVMLDTDMIIWKNLEPLLGSHVIAAHEEELMPDIYPDPALFALQENYTFPREWDFTRKAANTAFLYMPDRELRDYYVKSALTFMESLDRQEMDPTVSMCFAEQRVLPMCVQAKGGALEFLLDAKELDAQDFVTHLWGYKRLLLESETEREQFCRRCMRRIALDYPEWAEQLKKSPLLARYGKEALRKR